MDFKDKMYKIQIASRLAIGKIEAMCGISNKTLREAVKDNRFPTEKIIEKLLLGMKISRKWWDTGIGDIFEEKINVPEKNPDDIILEFYRDLIEDNTEYRLVPKRILDDYKMVPDKIIDIIVRSSDNEIKTLNKHHEKMIEGLENKINRLEKEKADLLSKITTKN